MASAAPLRAVGLTIVRGDQTVLDGVDLIVGAGHRVGLIGPNGVGKSTLLRALAGLVPLDRGRVHRTPPSTTVGYLPQEPARSTGETVRELVARRTGVDQATARLDTATAAIAEGRPGAEDCYSSSLERWLALGGADLDVRVGPVFAAAGIDESLLDQPMATLSGGQAARIQLAALQLARFDVFLLDEPTNDLDLDGLARLESWIGSLRAGVALVSHDRTFLARTVTHVVELDEFTHRAQHYSGGWTAYRTERERARRHAWERFANFDQQRRSLAGRAQREREWATSGRAKVRRADEPDKNIRHFRINQTEQLAGRAARTERAIERLEHVDKPREPWELQFSIGSPGRSGDLVAELRHAVVDLGDFRLGPIDLTVNSGERIALLGANGSGKSTLLAALFAGAQLTAGDARVGPSVVVGTVDQSRHRFAEDRRLVDAFCDDTGLAVEEARTLLAKFGLGADDVLRTVDTLSPGERTRAILASLMANGANVLVLDEPTNHLDLPAIEQLESAIDAFAGTVVLVTHDRELLDHVRLTRRVELSAGRILLDELV